MRRIMAGVVALLGLTGMAVAQSSWEWIGPRFTNTQVIALDSDGTVICTGDWGPGLRVTVLK